MIDDTITLSPTGAARKDAILGALVAAQKRRRSRRLAVQSGAGLLAVLAAGVIGWASLRTAPNASAPTPPIGRVSDPTPPPGIQPDPTPASATLARVTVHNDPTVLARLSAGGYTGGATIIGDGELDSLLLRAGRPVGFIRTPGRFLLASDIRLPKPKPPPHGQG